jgi:serine-type D-Ala-D-Ala carboxypeptidase/endopeptidase
MIGRVCKAAFLSILFFSAVSALHGQMPDSRQTVNVEAIVGNAATAFLKSAPQVPGLSIGVLQDGKAHIYNYGAIEKRVEGHPAGDTLYPIASVTKTFTGTLLAMAVLEGKVKFDDDVRKYLDGKYPNLEYQGHPIRLEHLVNHNSGLPFNLPDIPENHPPFPPASSATREMLDKYGRNDFIADLHKVELKTVPGE